MLRRVPQPEQAGRQAGARNRKTETQRQSTGWPGQRVSLRLQDGGVELELGPRQTLGWLIIMMSDSEATGRLGLRVLSNPGPHRVRCLPRARV
eukprot:589436-Rhodomonas_salina.2